MARSAKKSVHRNSSFESLERRALLAGQIQITDFSSLGHLVGNGFGSDSMTDGKMLQLTTNSRHESRSVWYDTAVPIERFRTDFTFKSNRNTDGGDGLTFTLLNGPTTSLGSDGRGLGYSDITGNSVAVSFNQFNFAKFGSKFGIAINGERPPTDTSMTTRDGGIDLHSGHKFRVTVQYDGKELEVFVTDATNAKQTFTASQAMDLHTILGAKSAIVGFTAATGQNFTTQDVLSWNYSGSKTPVAPKIASAAQASPEPASGTTTNLTALGSDSTDSESNLKYSWKVMSAPAGAKATTLSAQNTNAAKSVTATFSKDGSYVFRCTVTNSAGLTATSDVKVHVMQTATNVALSPHLAKVKVGQHVQFDATMLDQFGHAMRTQPTFKYTVSTGSGKINSHSGLYTAPSDEGHDVVEAYAMNLSGTVGVMVKPQPPASPHSATP